jgi:hypothetical protein
MMRPVETMPTRLGHLRIDSGPVLGYSMPFSSTQFRAVPDSRGHVEQRLQLTLPLPDERLRCEDQDRLLAGRAMSCAAMASWMVLPRPTWSAKTKRAPCGTQVRIEGELHEVLLMLPEPDLLAIDRRLDHGAAGSGWPRQSSRSGMTERTASRLISCTTASASSTAKGECQRAIELLLHPGHRVLGVVLPQQLVVQTPGGERLVDAAEERPCAVHPPG